MHRLTIFVALTIIAPLTVIGQQAVTFAGKLDPQLVVDTFHIYQRVWSSAVDTSKLKFSPVPEKGSAISSGELIDQRVASGKSQILLVEPPAGVPYIWFDSNENGIFEAAEKVPMNVS